MPVQTELYLQQSSNQDMVCSLEGQQVLCRHCVCATVKCPTPTHHKQNLRKIRDIMQHLEYGSRIHVHL